MKEFMKWQRFATQTTLLNTPGNDLSPEMKTFYDRNLIENAEPLLVHDQFGQERDIPRNGGKTIEFRKFSSLPKALAPITEGVTPAGNKLNVTAITATVAQYGDFIEQSDVLELSSIDNTIVEATTLLGSQAGRTMDTVTREVLQSGTNVMYAPKVVGGVETAVTSRAALTKDAKLRVKDVFRVAAALKAANAPKIDGKYVSIIHPYVAYDLMMEAGNTWVDIQKYKNPEKIYAGEIGELGGVRFVESTEAKIYKGEDLASDARTLAINNAGGYSGAITTVAFDGGTVAASALVGRKIVINGVSATVTANSTSTITFASTNFGTVADNAVIYPGEGGSDGGAVFGCLFMGANAFGKTTITGGGLQTIVKQKGSAGTGDPLDQRSTVGWKAIKTSEILVDEYLVRFECMSSQSDTVSAN